jgi:hypothetical protein
MASRVVAKPDWKTLPVPITPSWYDSPKVRSAATGGFALLGVVFGASFYYTASLARFLLLGLAVASFEVAHRALAPPQDKNAMAVSLRERAGVDIEQSGTFKDFQTRYHDLLSRKILKLSDVNFVVERDVQVLDYAAFMTKHADASCKRTLIDALQPTSREMLRAKCLAMLVENPAQAPDEADNALLDRKAHSANEQALMAKNWDEFINGGGRVNQVTDPAALEALKRLFLAKAYRREIDPRVAHHFPEAVRKSIETTMIVLELELVANDQLPLLQMQWYSTEWEAIVDYFPQIYWAKVEPLKQKLRDHYLTTLSSDQLKSEEFKRRREACGITPEMIENAQGSVRSECQRLPYLGAGGFREKYGSRHLNDGSLTPELLDKVRAEFRARVTIADPISREIYQDALILGLGEEILAARWMNRPLKAFWQQENELFLFYCENHPEVIPAYKKKIIEEFKDLSIFDIVRLYRELFLSSRRSICLLPTDQSASGKTFAEMAQEAVQAAGKLDAEVSRGAGNYGPTVHFLVEFIQPFLTYGLLSPTDPILRGVIKTSLDEYGQKLFENTKQLNYDTPDLWKKLATSWSNLNNQVLPFYKRTCAEVQKAREEFQAAKAKIDQEEFKSDVQTARNKKWSEGWRRLDVLRKEKEEFRRERRWDVERAVSDKKTAVTTKQRELVGLQSALRGFPDVQRRLEAQITAFGSQPAPDSKVLIEGTQKLQNMRTALQAQQQQYTQQLSVDAGRKIRASDVARLQEQQRKAAEEAEPTRLSLSRIDSQIEAVTQDETRKVRELDPPSLPYGLSSLNPIRAPALPEARKAELRKGIETDGKRLEELQKQRAEALRLHEPFSKRYEQMARALRAAEHQLEIYIKELDITIQLEAAKDQLSKQEEAHLQLIQTFEMFANRGEILKKLRANLAALPADIEKCRADLVKAEEALRKAKEEHVQAQAQETALNQQELAKAREIEQLDAEQKRLNSETQSNPEVAAFSARKQELKDKLDAAYQAMVKGHLATFEKMLLPEIAATS